jgi:hypothetical protein
MKLFICLLHVEKHSTLLHVKISFFFLSEWREVAKWPKREKEADIMNALLYYVIIDRCAIISSLALKIKSHHNIVKSSVNQINFTCP